MHTSKALAKLNTRHSNCHQANIASILKLPTTIHEALNGDDSTQWKAAIDSELESLIKNKTWKLTPLPSNRKPISSKWIFKIKTNPDGSIQRYKAMLVTKGFTQVPKIDYIDTISPVVKLNSIKLILALVARSNLESHQLEVKIAFFEWNFRGRHLYEYARGIT